MSTDTDSLGHVFVNCEMHDNRGDRHANSQTRAEAYVKSLQVDAEGGRLFPDVTCHAFTPRDPDGFIHAWKLDAFDDFLAGQHDAQQALEEHADVLGEVSQELTATQDKLQASATEIKKLRAGLDDQDVEVQALKLELGWSTDTRAARARARIESLEDKQQASAEEIVQLEREIKWLRNKRSQ